MRECIYCGKKHDGECEIADLKEMILRLIDRIASEASRADNFQARWQHTCGPHCHK